MRHLRMIRDKIFVCSSLCEVSKCPQAKYILWTPTLICRYAGRDGSVKKQSAKKNPIAIRWFPACRFREPKRFSSHDWKHRYVREKIHCHFIISRTDHFSMLFYATDWIQRLRCYASYPNLTLQMTQTCVHQKEKLWSNFTRPPRVKIGPTVQGG